MSLCVSDAVEGARYNIVEIFHNRTYVEQEIVHNSKKTEAISQN
jgi:4-hydroxy-3-methylbut-2-enyl diphosphate reductase IspH